MYVDYRLGHRPIIRTGEPGDLMWVPPMLLEGVCFLMYASKPKMDVPDRYLGTAFFLQVEHATGFEPTEYYAVTARHLISKASEEAKDGQVWLRINYSDGKTHYLTSAISDWRSHPPEDPTDVAVLGGVPPQIDGAEPDVRFIDSGILLGEAEVAKNKVSVGDDLFLTGLFDQYNQQFERNVPIVRVGTIAAMPPPERVETRRFGRIDAYLVETRSIGGLSGSPVFIAISGRIRGGEMVVGGPSFRMLGLMHGHWNQENALADYDAAKAAEHSHLNVGIALVVPAQKILDTLAHPEFRKMHEEETKAARAGVVPVEDAIQPQEEGMPREEWDAALNRATDPVTPSDEETA
jgi:hypothetical protein